MKIVGVFYKVFYNPLCIPKSRVLNFALPDGADPKTYPILEVARAKLDALHPDCKSFTIVAISRDGAIETDGENHAGT